MEQGGPGELTSRGVDGSRREERAVTRRWGERKEALGRWERMRCSEVHDEGNSWAALPSRSSRTCRSCYSGMAWAWAWAGRGHGQAWAGLVALTLADSFTLAQKRKVEWGCIGRGGQDSAS